MTVTDDRGVTYDLDVFRTFSASLPAIFQPTGATLARSWNGRDLTLNERAGAYLAARDALLRGESQWFAAQAAHEWLSEHAW